MKKFFSIIFLLFYSFVIYAHPGRTDSYGGHHDRINGGYHYHSNNDNKSFNYVIDENANVLLDLYEESLHTKITNVLFVTNILVETNKIFSNETISVYVTNIIFVTNIKGLSVTDSNNVLLQEFKNTLISIDDCLIELSKDNNNANFAVKELNKTVNLFLLQKKDKDFFEVRNFQRMIKVGFGFNLTGLVLGISAIPFGVLSLRWSSYFLQYLNLVSYDSYLSVIYKGFMIGRIFQISSFLLLSGSLVFTLIGLPISICGYFFMHKFIKSTVKLSFKEGSFLAVSKEFYF